MGVKKGKPKSRSDSRDSGSASGGFVIVDRSGKTHSLGGRAKRDAEPSEEKELPSSPLARKIASTRKDTPAEAPRVHNRRPGGSSGGEGKRFKKSGEKNAHKHNENRPSGRDDRGGGKTKFKSGGGFNRNERPDRGGFGKSEARSGGGKKSGGRSGGRDARGGRDSGGRDSGRGGRDGRRRSFGPKVSAMKARGSVDKNRKGFGFIAFEDRRLDDAFIPPFMADTLFHGDRVEANLTKSGEVIDIRVLEHRFRELVGRYMTHPGGQKGGLIVYERKKAREEVYTPNPPAGVNEGDYVQARIEFHDGRAPTAEILQNFGESLPASADIGMLAAEYNLTEKHSERAEAEARALTLEIEEDRTDLRHIPFITIDGETARDFDDAVYVEREKSNLILWVAIADVSNYVKPGTALDDEALARGTSVYFPERAFHMLPKALSESLCSLKPDEPRLAMVCKMRYDHNGVRTDTEVFDAVIESKRRATYNQIQEEYEAVNKSKESLRAWEYSAHFELYEMIKAARFARGSIDFDFPESETRVDAQGEPISIEQRPRLEAHRLIEEFMIAANEAVTVWAIERKLPFVYRVHDEPSQMALDKFQKLARNMGVQFQFNEGSLNQSIAKFIKQIEKHPAKELLHMQLLRSMKQAMYTSEHRGHFGLGSTAYTHFTSPIRRYPDLLVHRMLRMQLQMESNKIKPLRGPEAKEVEKKLEEMAEHCSYRERVAALADREAQKLKQVRMMMKHLGETFSGKINGLTENGFFIQLDSPFVEGFVPKDSITDDFYQFAEEKMVMVGARKKRAFRIGDRMEIVVTRADLDARQVEFELLEFKTQLEKKK